MKFEDMARQLENSGLYRILRKLNIGEMLAVPDDSPTRTGVFIDIESTGLNHKVEEVIEIALLPFKYSLDGRIFSIEQPMQQLNEPSMPISSEITAITGLTDEMVKGQRLNLAEIENCVQQASLIVAHNAGFDRPFAERLSLVFAQKPWACTMRDVPWKQEGIEGRRLTDLLATYGYFFDPHRAIDDCTAGLGLLTCKLPHSGRRVLDSLLEAARESKWRVFAVDAPFQFKDLLKRRGYRWNSDDAFGPRAWWIDISKLDINAELDFLKREVLIYSTDIPVFEVGAHQRYSSHIQYFAG